MSPKFIRQKSEKPQADSAADSSPTDSSGELAESLPSGARETRHFRIVYLANESIIQELSSQFRRVGADFISGVSPDQSQVYGIGNKLASRLMRFGLNRAALFGSRVYFYADLYACVKELSRLDPELVIVDERGEGIRYEAFHQALQSLSPRDFYLPHRRVVAVLGGGSEAAHQERTFQLGGFGIRGVLVEPRSAVQIFTFASQELHKMWEGVRRRSICISGGGVEGYVYALGVARALDVALSRERHEDSACLGPSLNDFEIYCGVSSGAILATCLAAGIKTEELLSQVYRRPGRLEALTPRVVFDLASGEILKRVWSFLKVLPKGDLPEIISRLQRLVPIGFFKGDRLRKFIENQLKRIGQKDSFLSIDKELYISATDQDTGEHVVFGQKPWKDIRLSQAIRASCALPPFYLPERIKGHWFADGQLTSSSDFAFAISRGAGLVVLIDPMVAYTSNEPGAVQKRGGFFSAIQAIKSLVQTRARSMWKHTMDVYPDVDFILFQPTHEVMEAMAGNPMRYRIRTELTELGFRGALRQMIEHYDSMQHKLEKHGFRLRPVEELQEILREPLDTASTFLRRDAD